MRSKIRGTSAGMLATLAGLALGGSALGQAVPPPSQELVVQRDSGFVAAAPGARDRQVVWSTLVQVPGSGWLRLRFDQADLSGVVEQATGSFLRITSAHDGGQQLLNAEGLAQWRNSTAAFNGDAVLVELVASPGTGVSRVRLGSVEAGLDPVGIDSICGPHDNRVLSFDDRAGRLSTGCTAWMFNDTNNQFITAGHCGIGSGTNPAFVGFRVPLSTTTGAIVQPPPSDQYVVDLASSQSANSGIGNDWRYMGVFPNTNTGLMPIQAYNAGFYILQPAPALAAGQVIRITGYGTNNTSVTLPNGQPVPPQWNQVQRTDTGPRVAVTSGIVAQTLEYQPDTTGGNSGSAVVWENAPLGSNVVAIGVHTHAGCTWPTQGASGNRGSNWFAITAAVNALNNPLTVTRTGRGTPGGSLFAIGDVVNNFGTLSTTAGQFAKVSFGPAWSQGLSYASSAGVFYAVDLNPFNGSQRLWTVTPAGVSTQVATLSGSPGAITGLGFASSSGTLYGVASNGARVIINTSTGAVTSDGVANPGTAIGAVEFDDDSGFLYGIDDAGGASRLVRFTPATGAIQVIGPLGAGIADCNGLAITQQGEFYTINAANEQLLRINPATGVATVVGPTGGLFGSGFGLSAIRAGACYANCDGSTLAPVLTPADFVCFLNKFRAGDAYANCDGSTGSPTLTPADFVCFLNAFRTGCP